MSGKKWAVEAWGGPANLKLLSFPLPTADTLGATDVLVRILATTATYTDQLTLKGNYNPCPPLPCTPGYDLIGDIVAVGSAVQSLAVGDRVAGMPRHGGAATHIVLPQEWAVKVRADVPPGDAVSVVLTGVTAYQMLHRSGGTARLSPTSRLLIHACGGGTGAMLVELAKLAGVPADRIFGTCSAKSMGVARDLGICAFDYNQKDWSTQVLAATKGEGVDLVLDPVFLGRYWTDGLACLRSGGKYIAYGVTNSADPGSLPLATVICSFMRLGFQNSFWSHCDGKSAEFFNVADERDRHPDWFAQDLRTLMDLVANGTLHPVVGRVWQFTETQQALTAIQTNTHTGKQIILVDV